MVHILYDINVKVNVHVAQNHLKLRDGLCGTSCFRKVFHNRLIMQVKEFLANEDLNAGCSSFVPDPRRLYRHNGVILI